MSGSGRQGLRSWVIRIAPIVSLGAGAFWVACGGSQPTASPTGQVQIATATPRIVGESSPTPAPTPTPTATTLPSPTATPTPTPSPTPSGPVAFRVETFVSGLTIPWEMVFLPDGRIFVTERPGRVRVIQNGTLLPQPVLTVPDVAARGEGGLLGMALDPAFAQNHWVYLYYTYATGGALRNRVVRYTESDYRLSDPNVILDGIPGATIHDGGRIKFGPDGKLYVTTGDASQSDLAQDRSSLAGKILRINADGSIPGDNPFPGSPVYSYGHRNPEGLAWQPGTNALYATEHGNVAHDEVNLIRPGQNYGWPLMQGTTGARDSFVPPIIESGTSTWAPSGATFIPGDTFPQFRGRLLFASLRGTTLWQLDVTANPPALEAIIQGQYGRLRDLVEGPDGTLYVLTSNRDGRGSPAAADDRILRIVPAG